MKTVYLYVWPGRRKVKAVGEQEFFQPQWGYQAKAKAWWIVRAETADHARRLVQLGVISDGVEPGMLDSNVVPALVEARVQRERTKHLEKEGPREGLPAHEMPKGVPIEMFTHPAFTWGTTAPHRMGEPVGMRHGYADIPYVQVPVIAPIEVLRKGTMIPMARQKAIGFADVMGWKLQFVPVQDIETRKQKFTDQQGKTRLGHPAKIRFEIIGGLDWKAKMGLRGW